MQRQTKQTPARRRTPQQIDLFAGEPRTTIVEEDTSGADRSDNTVDPRACRREPDWLDDGRRPSARIIWSARRSSTCGNRRLIGFCTTARVAPCNMPCDRLTALGWSEIDVIDDGLGRSAAGWVQRAGFERMVAQVCLGKVGAVAAREVSRFARNSRDWQQLTEMCRVVDAALIDQETIYAPRHGNDRLLLGLKGSLNEYALDLSGQSSLAARCGRVAANSSAARRLAS